VITVRHIKSVYRIVDDEMLVYAGPLEIPVNGSTEVKDGDLVLSFSPRPALPVCSSRCRSFAGSSVPNLSIDGDLDGESEEDDR
jgi:hypothetical protein